MKNIIAFIIIAAVFCVSALELDFTDGGKKLDGTYQLKLRGNDVAEYTEDGLKSVSMDTKDVQGGAILVKKHPEFSPQGAFECEIEFKIVPEVWKGRKGGRCYLFDSKYEQSEPKDKKGKHHCGFMMFYQKSNNTFQVGAMIGVEGKADCTMISNTVPLSSSTPNRLLLKFDPSGWQELYLNGECKAKAKSIIGNMAPAVRNGVVGSRYSSNYGVLAAIVQKVRIEPCEAKKFSKIDMVSKKYGSRRVFMRREKNCQITAEFYNTTPEKLEGTVTALMENTAYKNTQPFSAEADSAAYVTFPVESNLMVGKYLMKLAFADKEGKELGKGELIVTIVPEMTDFMPFVVSDHFEGSIMDTIHEMGFTHVHNILSARRGKMTDFTAGRAIESLDTHLEHGLFCDDKTRINERFVKDGKYLQINRNGKPYERASLDASEPAVYEAAMEAIEDAVKRFGSHPGWDRIYTNNEMKDGTKVSFTENTRKRLKAATGLDDIPGMVSGRGPISYSAHPNMPWNRVVPVTDPEYRFWQWFWREGDGWDKLNGDIGELAERGTGRKSFHSDFAPATRGMPYLGVGGKVSMVSTWVYCNPDPIKLGQVIDELICLADKKKLYGVGNQGIWYRNQTAPSNMKVENPPEWLAREQNAKYISPAPDSLMEGFWIAITRRVAFLDTHGQGSWLRPRNHSYRYTNPEVTKVFPKFIHAVVQPLGPALKHVDDIQPEVMILESFTNALYGGGHPWGWGSGWIPDLHMALQWAHIQAGFCYEEHIFRGDLDNGKCKVLILPSLAVLSDKLLEKLRSLQANGLILMADENLNQELMPDIRFHSVSRNVLDNQESKAKLQKLGLELRKLLSECICPNLDASSQDLIVHRRASGEAEYIFAVNDKRTYGDYVGQWKRVMEKGLPIKGSISAITDFPMAAAYDLVAHKEIGWADTNGSYSFFVDLEPGWGSIILALPEKIAGVSMKAPEKLTRGKDFSINAFIVDKKGRAIKAVLPLEVTFKQGETILPGTGFYATDKDGVFKLDDTVALNMPTGKATLTIRCLASGKVATKTIEVK
ncbi:MAG: hypothetical protein J5746_06745 [Victivallales bacterium]|nr:hypothetical protein [Victivallales bacterium]